MLRQVKISGLSLNLQDPLLLLTGIHPRQTGGTSFDRVLRFRMRERPAYSNPGPVRAPEFCGDLVYEFKKLIGSNDFSF